MNNWFIFRKTWSGARPSSRAKYKPGGPATSRRSIGFPAWGDSHIKLTTPIKRDFGTFWFLLQFPTIDRCHFYMGVPVGASCEGRSYKHKKRKFRKRKSRTTLTMKHFCYYFLFYPKLQLWSAWSDISMIYSASWSGVILGRGKVETAVSTFLATGGVRGRRGGRGGGGKTGGEINIY